MLFGYLYVFVIFPNIIVDLTLFCVTQLDDCVLCKIYNTDNRKSSEQDEDHPEVVSDINTTTQLLDIDPTMQLPQVLNT